jgi:hypothetical protein
MTQQPALVPLDELNLLASTVQQLSRSESELRGVARHAQLDMARVAVEISECDALLMRKEDIQHALLALQMKVQAKNKGVFEDLLTSLIHEIMPGKTDDKIVFTSSMRNNLAALDVDILSKGNLENVNRDRGGSIANIVAMGLRFVVLARHPNRRVLFLDEADCHLAEIYIPAFAAVMQQLAHRLGIQVVYISHKPAAFFAGYARIIEIHKDEGKTHARTISDETLDETVEYPDSALRYIRLKDFGPHENILVELGPGVNVIIGDNDLGKSKFITAVSELLDNDGSETRIRHERPEFEVEIGLEEGMTLIWKYARKGSSRTSMVLKDKEGVAIESSSVGKGKVPDWLHTYLAMGRIHGQDIHVHPQDEPKYLLSSRYTPIDRAKMLPLGRESRDVQRMLQQFTQQLHDAKQRKAALEIDLNRIKNLLKILSPLLEGESDEDVLSRHAALLEQSRKTEKLKQLGIKMAHTAKVVDILSAGIDGVNRHIVVPVHLTAADKLSALISATERNAEIIRVLKKITSVPASPKMPQLRDSAKLMNLGIRWGNTLKAIEILKQVQKLEPLPVPQIKDLSKQSDLIARMTKSHQDLDACKARLVTGNQKAEQLKIRKQNLIDEMGGICPTCQQTIGAHSHA